MKQFVVVFFAFILLSISMVLAQGECPALVETALAQVGEACSGLGRNEICYGNNRIDAQDWEQTALADFATAGDTVDISSVATLSTTALNTAEGVWGIAVLSLQANLPDSLPGQNVTFIVFGAVQLESENPPDVQQSEDTAFNAPMQAFRFVSGVGESECTEAPQSGILVQAPQNLVVSLTINGVRVDVSSTALITAPTSTDLQVFTFEGQVGFTSPDAGAPEGVFRPDEAAAAGFTISASEGNPPAPPEEFDPADFQNLPFDLLPVRFEIPDVGALPTIVPPVSATVITLSIPGNASDWVDTGIRLEPRDVFTVQASGEVTIWPGCDAYCADPANTPAYDCTQLCPALTAGPNGSVPIDGIVPDSVPHFVLPHAPMVALLARIGDGEPFVAGANATFVSTEEGSLQFRVNEDMRFLGDETGTFEATLSVFRASE